jgi:hypothetical protein
MAIEGDEMRHALSLLGAGLVLLPVLAAPASAQAVDRVAGQKLADGQPMSLWCGSAISPFRRIMALSSLHSRRTAWTAFRFMKAGTQARAGNS